MTAKVARKHDVYIEVLSQSLLEQRSCLVISHVDLISSVGVIMSVGGKVPGSNPGVFRHLLFLLP